MLVTDHTVTIPVTYRSVKGHIEDLNINDTESLQKERPVSDWELMEKPDFLGVNVYHGTQIDEAGNTVHPCPGHPRTANKGLITPEAMRFALINMHRRYADLPIHVSENGLSCNDKIYLDGKVHDLDRIDFLHRNLLEIKKAIVEDGVPVFGYFHWSLLDNFEWSEGYNERFGLVYVDFATLKRTPKDSASFYAETIRTNGENL